jgi:hypothetical protein
LGGFQDSKRGRDEKDTYLYLSDILEITETADIK